MGKKETSAKAAPDKKGQRAEKKDRDRGTARGSNDRTLKIAACAGLAFVLLIVVSAHLLKRARRERRRRRAAMTEEERLEEDALEVDRWIVSEQTMLSAALATLVLGILSVIGYAYGKQLTERWAAVHQRALQALTVPLAPPRPYGPLQDLTHFRVVRGDL